MDISGKIVYSKRGATLFVRLRRYGNTLNRSVLNAVVLQRLLL